MELIFEIGLETIKITSFVLIMMLAVDMLNLKTKGKLEFILKGSGKWKQYVIASLLGVLPGCLGSFAGVSLYMHGMISFGALTGLMFATAGDEQFVMLSMFPLQASILFLILFILAVPVGYLTDLFIKKLSIKTRIDCDINQYHPGQEGYKHYFKDHIWEHIIKKHILKIFLWTFGALLMIELMLKYIDLKSISLDYTVLLLILGALVGLIPESGPHLVFVMLFSKGIIPFSVLFTSSVVQDGHGMLPMLSYSIKDSALIKLFNLFFALVIGIILFLLGF